MSIRRRQNLALDNLALRAVNDTIISVLDIVWIASMFLVLVVYVTFPTTQPSALAGIAIGSVGLLLTAFIYMLDRGKWMGDIKFEVIPLSTEQDITYSIIILLLAGTSLGLQAMVLWWAKQTSTVQSSLTAPTDPVGFLIFVEAMATMEECFFRLFFYRFLRKLSAGYWIVAVFITSAAFGFGYHQYVYSGNVVLMTAAFFGSVIYCFSLQYTRRLIIPIILHSIQNFGASVGQTQSLITLSIYWNQLSFELKMLYYDLKPLYALAMRECI